MFKTSQKSRYLKRSKTQKVVVPWTKAFYFALQQTPLTIHYNLSKIVTRIVNFEKYRFHIDDSHHFGDNVKSGSF